MASFRSSFVLFLAHIFLLMGGLHALPARHARAVDGSDFWLANMKRQGAVPFGHGPDYKVFRNVKDYGAKGMSACPVLLLQLT